MSEEMAAALDRAQKRLRGSAEKPPPSQQGVDPHMALIAPVPRIALTQTEACEALGCSEEFFVEHIRPHLRVVRGGRKRLFPVRELERAVDQLAESVM